MSWIDDALTRAAHTTDKVFGSKTADIVNKVLGVVAPIVGAYYGGPWGAFGASAIEDRKKMYVDISRGADPKQARRRHYKNTTISAAIAGTLYGINKYYGGTGNESGKYYKDKATTQTAGEAQADWANKTNNPTGLEKAGAGPESTGGVVEDYSGQRAPTAEQMPAKDEGLLSKTWSGLGDYGKAATIMTAGNALGSAFAPTPPTSSDEYRDILAEKRRANQYSSIVSGGQQLKAHRPDSVRVLTPQQLLAVSGSGNPAAPYNPSLSPNSPGGLLQTGG